jgi:hypothetical protein
MGIMRLKEFLPKNISWFFYYAFSDPRRSVRAHPPFGGKLIPQNGKKLPTSGIVLEKQAFGTGDSEPPESSLFLG